MALVQQEPLMFRKKVGRKQRREEQVTPPNVAVTPATPIQAPYYFEDHLRKVKPYHFTYNTWCKQRWRGRELLEVFAAEFRDRPIEYYKDAIERGYVTLNGKTVTPSTIVKNGEVVCHTLHRHEPPVTDKPIGVVHEDDDLVVINKPAGVPVHPAGRYNFNSLIEIMRFERGQGWNPLPCNRLDRLTSGIMFIGKHPSAAEKISVQLQDRDVRKEYVARVVGEFPEGDVVCEQPVMSISPKLGLSRARASGKTAKTVFKRLAYYPPRSSPIRNGEGHDHDGHTEPADNSSAPEHMPWKSKRGHSIVRCLPVTGRTHQLRVHLQYLGHPISNDPIYANQRVFGPQLGAFDSSSEHDSDIISSLSTMGKTEVADAMGYHDDDRDQHQDKSESDVVQQHHDEMIDDYNKRKAEKMTGEKCETCGTELYSDPGAHELGIYLHAKRYECGHGSWCYETGLPDWALPPKGYEGPVEVTVETEPKAGSLVDSGTGGEGKAPVDGTSDAKKVEASEEEVPAGSREVP